MPPFVYYNNYNYSSLRVVELYFHYVDAENSFGNHFIA